MSFDSGAARARKEETSKQDFQRYKDSSAPPKPSVTTPGVSTADSAPRTRTTYVPDSTTIYTRPERSRTVYNVYHSRPTVVYRDPYNSFFWWWLLDRSLDDRAYWAYHHRHNMDPARYNALVADNRELEERIEQLEAEQTARDPSYVPPNLDRDLMYTDRHVSQTYNNRRTSSGSISFWVFGIGGVAIFFWLVFIKRWQTSTA